MNILYIGMYRQSDGWGHSAKNTVEALLRTGHNIAIRPIYMNRSAIGKIDEVTEVKYKLHEGLQFDKYDVTIQHTLPDLFVKNRGFGRNIGFFHSETFNLCWTGWPYRCSLMDDIWVSSKAEQIEHGGKFIQMGFDTEKYDKQYKRLNIPSLQHTFNFYTIADVSERKNIDMIVRAFHTEFDYNEPVSLVVKTGNIDREKVRQHYIDIKRNLRTRRSYKEEVILTGLMPEDDINALHQMCHCFVLPSYGESICIPLVDALGFGNEAIVTDGTGMTDYAGDYATYIKSTLETVYCKQPPLSHLYTSHEYWLKPNFQSLCKHMRTIYEDRHNKNSLAPEFVKQELSLDKYAKRIRQCLA